MIESADEGDVVVADVAVQVGVGAAGVADENGGLVDGLAHPGGVGAQREGGIVGVAQLDVVGGLGGGGRGGDAIAGPGGVAVAGGVAAGNEQAANRAVRRGAGVVVNKRAVGEIQLAVIDDGERFRDQHFGGAGG